MTKCRAIGVGVVLSVAGAAHADLLTNGGFDAGSFSGWTQTGDTGFTFVTASFAGFTPVEGPGLAAFGNTSFGYLSQTVALPANSTATIRFHVANNFYFDGITSYFGASFGGTSLLSLTNPAQFGFTEYVFENVLVTAANPTLTFTTWHPSAYFFLDEVSVTQTVLIPLPSGAALGLVGLGLVGVTGRAMRRRYA